MANLLRISYYLIASLNRLRWHPDKLKQFQEKRLRSIVNHAYGSVPFYHGKLKEAGIRPSDIKTLADLSKLPIIKKAEFKSVDPRRLVSAHFDIRKLKPDRTSGSTGQFFTTYLTKREDDWRKAIYMRANISCGQRPRDHWVVVTAPHHFGDTTNIQRRLGIFSQICVSVFNPVDKQIKSVSDAEADVLDGYSGSLLLLAKEVEKRKLKSIHPRIILGTADLIDAASREFIETVFEAPFYDQFGCGEIDRSAWQCPEKIGYHMDVDSVITEFVDDQGREVSAGKRGEVVYTSLFNYAMPFLRYAVGDIGVSSDEKCPCGRVLPLMKVVEGRKDAVVILPDGRLLAPMVFWVTMRRFFDRIMQYKVVQKKLDLFEIYIQKKDNNVDEANLETQLKAHLAKTLDFDKLEVDLKVIFVHELPLSKTGKLTSVVSELKS